ncbi:GMC family oxidoreductase [Agromyces sp. Soil535]|uniref:GMC family oxidoreductase n=1 Tax=Agromyces sp. Soil535 TaxID=1736390 RepID=UPI0006F40002|nr:GMC family oxidoreductase N-terminal domain-containing protein [Agromyces sp. Soil535]KRE31466.1 choline dehydrogenase [Agromyces sp. Soil535]
MAAGTYHYVIVGAGSAGCVLANRLSADPACQVALLEAGGPDRKREIRIPAAFTRLFLTEYDWNYRTTKQPQLSDRALYWPRGKTLGGSSSINGQAWTRGHRADYDGWAQSCPGWSYDEVVPYFQRAERRVGSNIGGVYGTSGPQFISELRDPNPTTSAFLAACAELDLRRLGELNEPDNTGYAPTAVTQRRGLRHSAADAYLRPARRRHNLTVLTGAHALRILLDGTRATGVEYRDAAGVTQRMSASREVILSAGTINSPQLLMLSGIGDADQLRAAGVEPRHDLVGVGANLQDHLAAGVVVHCPKPITLVAADSPVQLVRFLLTRRGMLTSSVNEAVAFVRSDPALAAPDLELVWLPVPLLGGGLTPPPAHGLTLGVELLQPDSHGDIRLSSGDPAEPPVIDPGYLTAESDLRGLVAGARIAERLCDTAALRPYIGAPMAPYPGKVDDATVATLIREHAQTAYHPVGTCRMGSDDAAVVDCELRVRGLDGLRVVDASVMPRIIRGHTHAPTVMIAERAADLIRASKSPPREKSRNDN